MSEKVKSSLARINDKLKQLPTGVAEDALNQYAARMEGYADGFAAGTAYASKKKEE